MRYSIGATVLLSISLIFCVFGCEDFGDDFGEALGGASVVSSAEGHGLKATYFNNKDFTDKALERVDPVVDFEWGRGSPDSKVDKDTFSIQWTGFVEAKYSQTYTFYTVGDDGMRLYVNDELILSDWSDHGAREQSGKIPLEAGQLYSIKLEYYENGGGAVAKLLWSSPSQAKGVVSAEQLYTELPTDGPTITASGENAKYGEVKENAFDGNAKTKWLTFTDSAWIQYDFAGDASKVITQYSITSANDHSERDPRDWRLLGSNDGWQFVAVDERTGQTFSSRFQTRTFSVQNPGAFKIFRLDISSNYNPTSANSTQLAEIEFMEGDGIDSCPDDPNKTEPGACGCGVPEGSCGGELTNVALGKPTVQSTTAYGGESSRAVDGNTSGNWGDGTITHTAFESQPWWEVDLGAAYRVERVVLFNRTNCCSDRLSNFHVDYLDEQGSVIATKEHAGQVGSDVEIGLAASGVYGVRIQLSGTNFLSLAEVQVFGTAGGGGIADQCPDDPNKTEPGECGCGVPEGTCNSDETWESEMVYYNAQGDLEYKTDDEGNRIPDFSYVGYKYGAQPPKVKVVHSISPVAGDNTKHIQDAIDYVAKNFSKDSQGFRGALLLKSGIYSTESPVYVSHDGVVIRGSGRGDNPAVDTIIRSTRTGTDKEVFRLGYPGDNPDWAWTGKSHSSITTVKDAVIRVGQRSFDVQNSSPYSVGDVVVLYQKFNEQWLADVDDGGTVDDPGWTERGFDLAAVYVRQVESISGSRITLDAPVYYKLDRKYGEITLYRHNSELSNTKTYRNIGIENLRIDIETEPGNIFDNDHTQHGVSFISVIDGWAREVTALHFSESAVEVQRSMRITVDRCEAGPAVAEITGGRRAGYSIRVGGQQVLIRDSSAISCRHGFVLSGATKSSGVVVLRGELIDNITSSEGGHQQWSSGVLFDNCKVTSVSPYHRVPLINFLLGNRGDYGTSHGWAAVNSVVWNTDSGSVGSIVVQKPPTAQNYAIGCTGTVNDVVRFPGDFGYEEPGPDDGRSLYPSSLYEAQRAVRQ